MSSKRPHTKSRLGCKQCKQRRLKCSETPPRCHGCTRKGLECEFQQYAAVFDAINVITSSSLQAKTSPPARTASPLDSAGCVQTRAAVVQDVAPRPQPLERPPPSVGSYSMGDLGLLHHFTLQTASTIGAVESEMHSYIWQQQVPRLAQSHGFLMHAMLGMAAAHQVAESDVDPALRDYSVVRQHYSAALCAFRESVDVLNEERTEALLCFTILTAFLTLYLDCVTQPADCENYVSGLLVFLRVVQNSTRVLGQLRSSLRSSAIGALLSHTWSREPHPIPPETEHSLSMLERLAWTYLSSTSGGSPGSDMSGSSSSSYSNISESAVLIDGLSKLRQLFSLTSPRVQGWKFILLWPIQLDPVFLTLLENGNPIALCALAHWCVPIFQAPKKWFTADFAVRILQDVARKLRGTPWAEGLNWPLKKTLNQEPLAYSKTSWGDSGAEPRLADDMVFY